MYLCYIHFLSPYLSISGDPQNSLSIYAFIYLSNFPLTFYLNLKYIAILKYRRTEGDTWERYIERFTRRARSADGREENISHRIPNEVDSRTVMQELISFTYVTHLYTHARTHLLITLAHFGNCELLPTVPKTVPETEEGNGEK